MKKLEKKQVPQVVACGLVTVAALGYTVHQLTSGQPRPNPTPPRDTQASSVSRSYGPAPPTTNLAAAPGNGSLARFTTVPASFHADPFSPAIREETAAGGGKAGAATKPLGETFGKTLAGMGEAVRESVNMNVPQLAPTGEWTPAALRGFPRTEEVEPAPVPAPAEPGRGGVPAQQAAVPKTAPRPSLVLTGIIQGEPSVAILRGATDEERQVVRVNDRVAGRYVVKSITTEGVLLAAVGGTESDRWFLPLGGEKQ